MFSATAQALVVALFEQCLPLLFCVLPLLSGRPQLIRTSWTKCLIVCLVVYFPARHSSPIVLRSKALVCSVDK
jgi:hypothetical protein